MGKNKKYFIGLDNMSLDELEIWRLLCRYSDYRTDIAGYTVNQLLINSDKRLNLTARKIGTILKRFEKKGYIEFLTSGTKGKESTLLLTVKCQLFGNDVLNKNEHFQGVKEVDCQQSVNNVLILQKKKEKDNNKKEKETNFDKMISAYTDNNELAETLKDFIKMRKTIKSPLTDRALKGILNKLDKFSNSDFEKIEILENSIMNSWRGVFELKNKKTPARTGEKEKRVFDNKSISSNNRNYSQKIETNKFI